jgi:hypothetical protein
MIINISDIKVSRHVKGISNADLLRMKDYLQGLIYSWCNVHQKKWFAARDLVGRRNFYWQGTPVYLLYQKHRNKGQDNDTAKSSAAKDLGWILLKVIKNDKRHFHTRKHYTREYSWDGDDTY